MIFSPIRFPVSSSKEQISGQVYPVTSGEGTYCEAPPVTYQQGKAGQSPLVLSSPHSGSFYPEPFVSASEQSLHALRMSEDSYVDVLAKPAREVADLPLLSATFPRSFCDVNRAPWDLDPKMFTGDIPSFVRSSRRAKVGFGSVPRCVGDSRRIYKGKIPFSKAALRIRYYWMPYHKQLMELIEAARERYGFCLLLDLHSMPDIEGNETPDFILGTRFGTTSSYLFSDIVEQTLQDEDYYVVKNYPYAGGYITRHYGRPKENLHVIQLEIRRALYMDTQTYELRPRKARKIEAMLVKVISNILAFLESYSPPFPLER